MSVHPYNNNSDVYNFLFHPNHNKKTRVQSIVVNIALSIFSAGIWQVAFWIVNRIDNASLEKWKISNKNLPSRSDSIKIGKNEISKKTSSVDSKKRTIDLDKIFPKATSQPQVQVVIPDPVKKSLSEIFGIENVVDKMPVYEKTLDKSFDIKDVPHPIMKANDKNGKPSVTIKLRIADPEAYYDKHLAAQDLKHVKSLIKENKIQENEKDEYIKSYKEQSIQEITKKPHDLVLGQKYYDGSPLLWAPREHYYKDKEPSFFCKRALLNDVDQLTYAKDGGVIDSLKDKIPEFQKLFTEGTGTDVYENKWELFV